MSVELSACNHVMILGIKVDQNCRRSHPGGVVHLMEEKLNSDPCRASVSLHSSQQQNISSYSQKKWNFYAYLLCKSDLSGSQQQDGAFQVNFPLNKVQIRLTAVVSVHQPTLRTQTKAEV